MSVNIYTENDKGDLKLIAEIEGETNVGLAVDALLDEMPRLKDREFVAIVGDLDDGARAVRVTVEDDAPIQPRRKMTITGGDVEDDEDEEEAPEPPKRRGRPPGSGTKKAAKPAAKKEAAKPRGRRTAAAKKTATPPTRAARAKTAAAKKKGGMKRNAASDE